MISKRFSLFELNRIVRETIECEMPDEYWVEAELSECRESRGHCYLELIEKDEQTATPIAKASAKCWASKWAMVRPYFERTTGQRLVAGMKVLLKVYPQFHEAFGFSWIVTDIDPTYTLGDMARKRQEIIRQLKEEGVFDLQKELTLASTFGLSITEEQSVYNNTKANRLQIQNAFNNLKVKEYNYVSTNYTYDASMLLGNPATNNIVTNSSQHWDGTNASTYFEQSGSSWGASSWTSSPSRNAAARTAWRSCGRTA